MSFSVIVHRSFNPAAILSCVYIWRLSKDFYIYAWLWLPLVKNVVTTSIIWPPLLHMRAAPFLQDYTCDQRRIRSVCASAYSDQSSLSAWRRFRSLATHKVSCEDSDQIAVMYRLIWDFAGRSRNSVGNAIPRLIYYIIHVLWDAEWKKFTYPLPLSGLNQ